MNSEIQPRDFGLRRFVVLHHTGIDQPHFDFMFDTSDQSQLITFRMARWPALQSQAAARLRDHRRAYLDFEGAIPGDRGLVQRVDEGEIRVGQCGEKWSLSWPDGKAFAELEPVKDDPDERAWWMELSPGPAGA